LAAVLVAPVSVGLVGVLSPGIGVSGRWCMASEHEDSRDQQLEDLRRHMVRPDSQWEPPTELGFLRERLDLGPSPAGRRRPPMPWLLVAGLLVVVALVGWVVVGASAWSDDRPAGGDTRASGTVSSGRGPDGSVAAPVATAACKTAVDRANAMLASAVRLRGALGEQDKVLNDPASRGLSVAEVLERLSASQKVGASESARFDRALDAYRQVVDQCDLRAP
jgi:hypothetical protein